MASSIRFGFSSGPSMSSCKVSKFHFKWSFGFVITYKPEDRNCEIMPNYVIR